MPDAPITTPDPVTTTPDPAAPSIKPEDINANWRTAIDKEYAEHPSTADIKDLNGLVKSYINAQKLVGGEKLPKPKETWGKEEWADFNRQIGMPEDPKGYELDHIDGAEADEEWFRKIAHDELNLSNRQAASFWKALQGRNSEVIDNVSAAANQRIEKEFEDLKKEWGPNYDSMVKSTNKGLARFDEDGRFRKWMKATGLNKEPEMLRFASKIASLYTEDHAPGDTRSTMPMNRSQAKAQLNKIFSDASKDPSHPLMNKKDPTHAEMVAKITKLSDLAGGE